MVRAMFPDVPTAAIQADLQRTGSVETTVDNALRDGGLPMVIVDKTPIIAHTINLHRFLLLLSLPLPLQANLAHHLWTTPLPLRQEKRPTIAAYSNDTN